MKIKLVMMVIALFTVGFVQGQSKKELKAEKRMAQFKETATLIEDGPYEFVARSTSATNGRHIDLTTNTNFIRTTENSFSLYMPFFGRAYSATYGGVGGFEFDGEPVEYDVTTDDLKMVTTVTAKVKTKDDSLQITLKVSYDGYANLTITSNNRETVSYFGLVSSYEKEQKE